jgi:hypothetical protein
MDAVMQAQSARQAALNDLVGEVGQLEAKFVAAVLALKPAAVRLNELNDTLQLASRDDSISAGRSAWAQTHRAPMIAGLGARALVLVEAVEAATKAA